MGSKETGSRSFNRPPGFRDVAARADVSITTVERVLNERGSVSPQTRMKVLEAAEGLGLRRVLPSPDFGNLTIEAILPVNPTAYWAKLSAALKESARLLPRGITVHRTFVPQNDPAAMTAAITKSSVKRTALIVAAEIDEQVEDSLARTMRRGEILVSVSTMIHGLAAHDFSGIDNLAAGRTAASLVNFGLRGRRGSVLILQANTTMQSHRDRVSGFQAQLDKHNNLELIVTNETPGVSWEHLSTMLAAGRGPIAIYETGDPGEEIAPLLRAVETRPIWIGHERNSVHDKLMRDGLLDFVLDQDPRRQAHWALGQILHRLGIANSNFASAQKPELRLFCATNLAD